MEFFRIRRYIPFMRHALVFNAISFVTFALAVFFLATRGLHLSIEFTGGTVVEAAYARAADVEKVRRAVEGAGLLSRAVYVERGTMEEERIRPLAECSETKGAYFAMVLIPGEGRRL